MPGKTLVMHTGGWIGDMVLLTPALRALRRGTPEAHISMLLRPSVRELMERNPYLDQVIVYDKRAVHKGIRKMWRMAKALRDQHFDTAVILHPNSVRSAFLAFKAGIPERIGSLVRGREFFLTTRVKKRANIHEVQRYLDVVKPFVNADCDDGLEFWGINEEDEDFAAQIQAGHNGPVVGINSFTTWPSKQWPADRFADLAHVLSSEFGALIVFTGGTGDINPGNGIMERLGSYDNSHIVNLIGQTTLWQLGALLKNCHLYITCDSGPMHISAALGTPTIALFGPTDPVRHGPYGAGHLVIQKDIKCKHCYRRECESYACMRAILVEDVFEAVRKVL